MNPLSPLVDLNKHVLEKHPEMLVPLDSSGSCDSDGVHLPFSLSSSLELWLSKYPYNIITIELFIFDTQDVFCDNLSASLCLQMIMTHVVRLRYCHALFHAPPLTTVLQHL